jgi:hypothetical protein
VKITDESKHKKGFKQKKAGPFVALPYSLTTEYRFLFLKITPAM